MRIGLAGWSVHKRFQGGELTLLDYPGIVKGEFELDICEFNSPFFESTDDGYLEELKDALDRNGVQCVHISVDNMGDLGSTNESIRTEAVAKHMDWFRICKAFGCGSFRANTGSGANAVGVLFDRLLHRIGHSRRPKDENLAACIESFRELAREGERCDVNVCIENHGGISGDPDSVVRIMTEVGSQRIRTCPDFGNFPDGIRYEALARIMPYAGVVHAKLYEFDENGEDTLIDAARCMRIVSESGYDGDILIEFEGSGDDHDGVMSSLALIRRYMV